MPTTAHRAVPAPSVLASSSRSRWLIPLMAVLALQCGPSAPDQTGGSSDSGGDATATDPTTGGAAPTTGHTGAGTTGDASATSTTGEPGDTSASATAEPGDTSTSAASATGTGTSTTGTTSTTSTSTSTTLETGAETEGGEVHPLCAGLVTFVPTEDLLEGGYLILRTPADKQLLAGVECFVGKLALVPGLVDASGLESLRVVAGSVLAASDDDAAAPTATLFVGLDALEHIGGHFTIWGSEITSLHGLEALRAIDGSLACDADLDDLEGLEGLETIGGSLKVGYCAGEPLSGTLPSLAGLDSLTSVEAIILNAPKLTGPQVLPMLAQLPVLHVCHSGAAGLSLPALVEAGEIHITGSKQWTGLEAPSLTTLTGDLLLTGTGISGLDGLAGLTSIGGDLGIGANKQLPTCVAKAFAAGLMVAGNVNISGNLPDACGE